MTARHLPLEASTINGFTRLVIKTGRWPAPFGFPGRWIGRHIGAPMPHGLRLVIYNPLEVIQRSVISFGVYEPSIAKLFAILIRPNDIYFDVGGNIGHHALIAAGLGAQVHTFEPLPRLVERIRENAKFNRLCDKLVINNTALGAETGEAVLNELERNDDGSHSMIDGIDAKSSREVRVAITTLDVYAASAGDIIPYLIKIDVEGYESRVLDGAAQTLRTSAPPFIVMETGDRLANLIGESASSALGRLFDVGYQIWEVPESADRMPKIARPEVDGELRNYFAAHPAHPRFAEIVYQISQ